MDEKFVYEHIRKADWNINIPKECIGKRTNRIDIDLLAIYLDNVVLHRHWNKPGKEMPIKVDVQVYIPVPKGKILWFRSAGAKGIIPCVTIDGWNLFHKIVLHTLIKNEVISNFEQIHSFSYESTYSARPRIKITATAMYQNIGDIKAKIKEINAKKREDKNGTDNDG